MKMGNKFILVKNNLNEKRLYSILWIVGTLFKNFEKLVVIILKNSFSFRLIVILEFKLIFSVILCFKCIYLLISNFIHV